MVPQKPMFRMRMMRMYDSSEIQRSDQTVNGAQQSARNTDPIRNFVQEGHMETKGLIMGLRVQNLEKRFAQQRYDEIVCLQLSCIYFFYRFAL